VRRHYSKSDIHTAMNVFLLLTGKLNSWHLLPIKCQAKKIVGDGVTRHGRAWLQCKNTARTGFPTCNKHAQLENRRENK
jgi:hypothetical protein